MKEKDLRQKISHLKIFPNSQHYEIVGEFFLDNSNHRCKLIEVKAKHSNKEYILTFIEIKQ